MMNSLLCEVPTECHYKVVGFNVIEVLALKLLYIFCFRPGISHFSKQPCGKYCFFSVRNSVWRHQPLGRALGLDRCEPLMLTVLAAPAWAEFCSKF